MIPTNQPESDCYCMCHSPVSSCPSCEHCLPESDNLDPTVQDRVQVEQPDTELNQKCKIFLAAASIYGFLTVPIPDEFLDGLVAFIEIYSAAECQSARNNLADKLLELPAISRCPDCRMPHDTVAWEDIKSLADALRSASRKEAE